MNKKTKETITIIGIIMVILMALIMILKLVGVLWNGCRKDYRDFTYSICFFNNNI